MTSNFFYDDDGQGYYDDDDDFDFDDVDDAEDQRYNFVKVGINRFN